VDRKLDLLVGELERYGIAVAGNQETKWFGSDVWPAAKGYMLLHSCRPTPDAVTGGISRGESVGIVLNKKATAAWRAAGEEWRAVSSRLVMAQLKWTCKSRQRFKESFLTIICVYAPTARAPAIEKAVNKAKEDWIQKVTSTAEAAFKDGKVRWINIHRLQRWS